MSDWYLGSASNMVAIPAPAVGLDVPSELVGKVSQSLDGARTLYRAAQPRTWALSWAALTEDQATYLKAVGLGLVSGTLRLIDGEIRNRLPVRVSSAGSYYRTAEDFTQTGGLAPTWVAVTDPPSTVPVRGVISWQRTSTVAGALTTADTDDRVPLIQGQQLRVSMWARGAAIAASAALDAYDSAGTPTRTVDTPQVLSVSSWTYLDVTVTPSAGQVELAPVLNVAVGESASTLQVTGWQVALASDPLGWSVGGGAPVVLAGSELTDNYRLTGLRQFQLMLLERRM